MTRRSGLVTSTDMSALRASADRPVWKNIAVPFDAKDGENTGRRCPSGTRPAGARRQLTDGDEQNRRGQRRRDRCWAPPCCRTRWHGCVDRDERLVVLPIGLAEQTPQLVDARSRAAALYTPRG